MKLPAFLTRFSTLQLTLGVSVAVHAAILSVRFIDPEGFNRVFQDTPLEVILVNAKSSEKPEKAQAIAQFSLAGGGDADKGRATSPLPYSALTSVGDDFEEAQRKMDALQEQQTQLLAQLRKEIATLPAPDPRKPRLVLEKRAPATLVFDEVDTGIGGATSALVGRKLRNVAAGQQVLCITHLPQIAAGGSSHFLVEKRLADGRTSTSITQLDQEARVAEIARMLDGDSVSPRSLAFASELIGRNQ